MSAFENIQLHLVQELDDVTRMMQWLGERREWLAVDVETTGLNAGCDRIRLVQFGDGQQGWALAYQDWRGVVKQVIERYQGKMVAHNLLYDSKMLKMDGIDLPQLWAHDTLTMAHLLQSNGNHQLKPLCVKHVDRRAAAGQELLHQAFSQGGWTWGTVPIHVPAYWMYSTLDTCLTALLAEKLWPLTGGGSHSEPYELELAVIHCLREAECAGMLIDEQYRQAASIKLRQELSELEPQLPVNANADRQVVEYLQSIGARWEVYTENGNLSVAKEVLDWLAPQFPVCKLISQYRLSYRLLNNYIEKVAEIGTPKGLAVNGVIRCNTRPVEARTGRMSVTDPPLQQLPRGRIVRDAFVARPGRCLLTADFDNMEMRALASLSQDPRMLEAFSRGEDMHAFVAKAIWGDAYVRGTHRPLAKGVGFGKVYGAGVPKMAATAGTDVATMQAVNDRYEQLFPGVKTFMDMMTASIYEQAGGRKGMGYVTLQDGRKLPVEGDKAYASVNYRIQGGCAVTTKKKIVELDAAGLGDYFRLAVHDELIYEPPVELARDVQHVIEQVMPDTRDWPGVTLGIDSDIVDRWGAHYRDDYEQYIPTEEAEWMATFNS